MSDARRTSWRPVPAIVLRSVAGHGVHHLLDDERRTTFCGYRVRHGDWVGVTDDLPACAACYERPGVPEQPSEDAS